MNHVRLIFPGILLTVATLVGGCASKTQPSHFYSLGETPPMTRAADSSLTLALGPIDLPRYLDRPQLVTRDGANQLKVDEYHRWGGSLEEEMQRLLAAQLMDAIGTERVYAYPSRIVADTDYRLALVVRSYDGRLGGEVVLDVGWSVFDDRTSALLLARQAQYRTNTLGKGYTEYVAALNDLLGRLGNDLATSLREARATNN